MSEVMWGVPFLIPVVLLLPGSALAGRRVAAVAPSCASELATLQPDVEGDEDRCVATAKPGCQPNERLVVDSQGQADRCLPQASDPAPPESAREPKCVVGLSLEERPANDVCRGAEKPRCPSGLSLRALKGDDLCRK